MINNEPYVPSKHRITQEDGLYGVVLTRSELEMIKALLGCMRGSYFYPSSNLDSLWNAIRTFIPYSEGVKVAASVYPPAPIYFEEYPPPLP